MLAQEEAEELCEYYAENETPLRAYLALQTQWRVIGLGMGGAVHLGLEYASFEAVYVGLRIPPRDRPQLFADLQVMERAALRIYNAKADS